MLIERVESYIELHSFTSEVYLNFLRNDSSLTNRLTAQITEEKKTRIIFGKFSQNVSMKHNVSLCAKYQRIKPSKPVIVHNGGEMEA